ncbi:unnamed protein product [Linum tenue]|uniref:Uncharacterized protein n=1 Tax=Linum tenue TaxID=586396 RepID=A0AAV0IY65_9ROSI|nr:unnamed protein product [Linum tenue]
MALEMHAATPLPAVGKRRLEFVVCGRMTRQWRAYCSSAFLNSRSWAESSDRQKQRRGRKAIKGEVREQREIEKMVG